jgi:hypothetical protein
MKTYTKPSSHKLVDRFDNQLKSLLLEDLKTFIANTKFTNSHSQVSVQQVFSPIKIKLREMQGFICF